MVVGIGGRRGLLLPQVAVEQGFDRDSFLRAAMQKAGCAPATLPVTEAEIFVFEAELIHEADVPEKVLG